MIRTLRSAEGGVTVVVMRGRTCRSFTGPTLIRRRFTHFFRRALCLRPNGVCHLSDGYGFLWCFLFGSFLIVMTERGGGNRRTRGKRGKERGMELQGGASRHVRSSRYRFCKLHLTAQSSECSFKELRTQTIGFFSHVFDSPRVEIHFILTRF